MSYLQGTEWQQDTPLVGGNLAELMEF